MTAAAVPADPPARLVHLDLVRGIAILLVLGHHTPAVVRVHPAVDAVFAHLHQMGHLGVDLFFVLSGFLIGGLLFVELGRRGSIDVGRFLTRRAFKIWPAYLVALTACGVANAAFGKDLASDPHPFRTVFGQMWPAFFHVQNYFPSTSRFLWFWSLAVEEHFYLMLPWALLLVRGRAVGPDGRLFRWVVWLTAGVAVACLGLRGLARVMDPDMTNGYTHYYATHLRIDALMVGVLLAAAARFAPGLLVRFRPWRPVLAALAVGAFALPAAFPGGDYSVIYPFDCTLVTLGSACAVLLAYFADLAPTGGPARRVRGWLVAGLAFVGFYSYSIYLWHGYFGPSLTKRLLEAAGSPVGGSGPTTLAHLAAFVAVCVALGVVAYWLVERPALAVRERLFPRRARAVPAATP
jgi:peptidoglycan/LPS O-acetylase OafA/YrhL